jgi:hypothetical protein
MNYVQMRRQGVTATGAVMVTVIALLAVSLAGAVGGGALAKVRRAPTSEHENSQLRYQAPIGARQPRPQDMPPSVLRDEGHATASQRAFDKSLEICRPCGMNP